MNIGRGQRTVRAGNQIGLTPKRKKGGGQRETLGANIEIRALGAREKGDCH